MYLPYKYIFNFLWYKNLWFNFCKKYFYIYDLYDMYVYTHIYIHVHVYGRKYAKICIVYISGCWN